MSEERVDRDLAEAIRALIMENRQEDGTFKLDSRVTSEALLTLLKEALYDEMWFYPAADELVWDVARHEGYVIPACPVASRGDAKEFLQEFGVRNAEEWYEQRGVTFRELRGIYAASALMGRNTGFWRKVFFLPRLAAQSASTLAPYCVRLIDFCLGDDTSATDETLFRC